MFNDFNISRLIFRPIPNCRRLSLDNKMNYIFSNNCVVVAFFICVYVKWLCSEQCVLLMLSVAVLLQCEFADPCQTPWDSTQLLGHWQSLSLSLFLSLSPSHTHTQKVYFPLYTSNETFHLSVSDFCCWRSPAVQTWSQAKPNMWQHWHKNQKQQQQHKQPLYSAGYALSSDDTAFTKIQTKLPADLRRGPDLKSTYSTYWLLKLRVSEFTLHTLKEQGERSLSPEMCVEE